jgi:ribulose-5-phosphate 4-epimerase/fuculose-1-phosphate aldolase
MSDVIVGELSTRQQLALVLRILGQSGYQDKITGHLTLRDSQDGTLLVNPVDVFWADMKACDLLRVAKGGDIVEGTRRYNRTAEFHFEIHERRSDIHAVLHNHPPYGNIWAAAGRLPPLLDQTGANGGGHAVLVSEYEGALDNEEKATSVAESFGDADMAVLAHHGVLVTGDSLGLVLARALCFEWRCQKAYEVAAMGLGHSEFPSQAAGELAQFASIYGDLLLEVYGRRVIDTDKSVLDE